MIYLAIAVCYIASLGFIAFFLWLKKKDVEGSWKSEIQSIRDELSQLAMSVGLRRRGQPGPIPPTFGGPAAG